MVFWTQSLADIFLHLLLVGTFVIVFFFYYASKIERDVIKLETSEIVSDLSAQISAMLSDSQNKQVREKMLSLQYPDMSAADEQVKTKNQALLKKSFLFLAFFSGFCITVIAILWAIGQFSLKELFLHNGVALASVFATDFVFLTFFARNYKPSDSSVVKKDLFLSLQKWSAAH